MKITYLPTDYLINAIKENEDQTIKESTFLLRAIRIQNTFNDDLEILKLRFDLKAKGVSRQNIVYSKEAFIEKAAILKGLLERISVKQSDNVKEIARKANAGLFMGQEEFWEFNRTTPTFSFNG